MQGFENSSITHFDFLRVGGGKRALSYSQAEMQLPPIILFFLVFLLEEPAFGGSCPFS